ncbi:hypothetical protein [Mesorhizobium temperatum]|uniref:Uncharacterized protein n=1 Tax=Mesorhizobium temperatum TaxID=241416 RepID=A0A271LDM6_9HYPH|nr:hypothetical protein [Mesorhizobium temperatum]PAQ05420.1 hypothetical protein CIT26_30370 [Mesorhizobium temperatum]
MNFDVVDIQLLRDHPTELAQFGPSPLDLGIAPNMEVTDDEMVAAHLHVLQELKYAIGRDHVKARASRGYEPISAISYLRRVRSSPTWFGRWRERKANALQAAVG